MHSLSICSFINAYAPLICGLMFSCLVATLCLHKSHTQHTISHTSNILTYTRIYKQLNFTIPFYWRKFMHVYCGYHVDAKNDLFTHILTHIRNVHLQWVYIVLDGTARHGTARLYYQSSFGRAMCNMHALHCSLLSVH